MTGAALTILAGVLALVAGTVALVFPLPAGLAVTVFVAWALVISGTLGLWAAFADRGLAHRGRVTVIGLVTLVLGVWMLANPLPGLVSLTIVAGLVFVLSGGARLMLAPVLRGTPAFWPVALSGGLSLVLGLYALIAPMLAATVLLGTLLAIELVSVGVTLLALGIALRRRL